MFIECRMLCTHINLWYVFFKSISPKCRYQRCIYKTGVIFIWPLHMAITLDTGSSSYHSMLWCQVNPSIRVTSLDALQLAPKKVPLCHYFYASSGHVSVASNVYGMCHMHACSGWFCIVVVLQCWLMVVMYVGELMITGHEALIVHVLLSKFPLSTK